VGRQHESTKKRARHAPELRCAASVLEEDADGVVDLDRAGLVLAVEHRRDLLVLVREHLEGLRVLVLHVELELLALQVLDLARLRGERGVERVQDLELAVVHLLLLVLVVLVVRLLRGRRRIHQLGRIIFDAGRREAVREDLVLVILLVLVVLVVLEELGVRTSLDRSAEVADEVLGAERGHRSDELRSRLSRAAVVADRSLGEKIFQG